MTDPKSAFATKCLDKTFNAFLFASLTEEIGSAPLSMVSALTRLGVDPWEEAAELSRMDAKAAGERLARLLARLPRQAELIPNLEATAGRLVGLIPRATVFSDAARTTPKNFLLALSPPVAAIGLALGCLMLIVSVLLAHGPHPGSLPGGAAAQSSTASQLDGPPPAITK